MNNITTIIRQADQDWQYGMLKDAYDKYYELKQVSWHAAFQLAWIEAAFKVIDIEAVIVLQPVNLTPAAEMLVKYLKKRVCEDSDFIRLDGDISSWDIHQLRNQAQARDHNWWIKNAKLTENSGLLGVAMSCWREAEDTDSSVFFDPPSRMQILPLKIDTHLRALHSVSLEKS